MSKARDIASAAPAPSTVSATELGYLDGVTSAVQTQLNAKQAVVSGVNDTEIGYLDGVTSAIQTQLDAKTAKSTLTTTGDIYYASAANTPARLGIGSTGNVLTVASGIPSWATPAAGGMTLLSTTTLSGASVSLSGITSTYKALVIYIRGFQASGSATMQMRFNGVTLTVYENRLFSNTSTTSGTPTATSINVMPTSDATYGFYSQGQVVIPQYEVGTSSGIRKMALVNSTGETGSQSYNILNGVGYFQRDGHENISSITLFPSSGTFSAGTILLYGVN